MPWGGRRVTLTIKLFKKSNMNVDCRAGKPTEGNIYIMKESMKNKEKRTKDRREYEKQK